MKSGIYCLQNKVTGKLYIGSTVNFSKRKYTHFNELSKNTHPNNILQNEYNKYQLNRLLWVILEYCDVDILVQREQFWLNMLHPTYNICKIAGSSLGVKRSVETKRKISNAHKGKTHSKEHTENQALATSKPFKLLSPENAVIHGVNISKFCRENNLDVREVYALFKGKRKSYKGYRNISYVEPETKHEFLDEDGDIAKIVNLQKFCAENNSSHSSMRDVKSGKMYQHKDYRSPVHNFETKTYSFVSPHGEIFHVKNLSEFGKQHNIDARRLSDLHLGKRAQYMGWYLNFKM